VLALVVLALVVYFEPQVVHREEGESPGEEEGVRSEDQG
jgi:hypothetical protein